MQKHMLFTLQIESDSQREGSMEVSKTSRYRDIYKFLDKAGEEGKTVSMTFGNNNDVIAFERKIKGLNIGRDFKDLVRRHDILMVTFNKKLFFVPTRYLKRVSSEQIDDVVKNMVKPIINELGDCQSLEQTNIWTHKKGTYCHDIILKLSDCQNSGNMLNFLCTNLYDGILPSHYGTSRRGARQGK